MEKKLKEKEEKEKHLLLVEEFMEKQGRLDRQAVLFKIK